MNKIKNNLLKARNSLFKEVGYIDEIWEADSMPEFYFFLNMTWATMSSWGSVVVANNLKELKENEDSAEYYYKSDNCIFIGKKLSMVKCYADDGGPDYFCVFTTSRRVSEERIKSFC